jgi:tetratricopeptide (TPR) repeat protein
MGKQREAIDAFAELFERTPDFPNLREQYAAALWRYGRAALLRGDYIEGVSALQEILRVQPDNKEARKFLELHQFSTN